MNQSMNRILIPLDGSPQAESVLATVMPLVRAHAAEVRLLRVLEHPDLPEQAAAYLVRAAGALQVHGIRTVHDLALGKPAQAILDYARDTFCDLIAMSTHGRSGLARLVMGSVTEQVMRHADVPLLACRPGSVVPESARILVALDGSPVAEEILPEACRLARLLAATLVVVRVAVPIVMVGGITDYPMAFPPEDPLPYLKEVCARIAAEGVAAQPVALLGGPAVEIVRHAQAARVGMICLGSHGRTGLRRLVLGSVAEEVLRISPCPVLVRRHVEVAQPVRA